MTILDVKLNNFFAFKNFHLNLTYPKKIVGSNIANEHLKDRPNFRYKKVNIIMGANASGKTTLGRMLMSICNFITQKNYEFITKNVSNRDKEASFTIDMVCKSNTLYRVNCRIPAHSDGKYSAEDIQVEIRKENIRLSDSYESCSARIEESAYSAADNYIEELEKLEELDWLFEYPQEAERTLRLAHMGDKFCAILENILKALDPSIQQVEKSTEVENTYVIRLQNKAVILQDGAPVNGNILSSGTKAGIAIAQVVASILQGDNTFYYCDEKFSYIHSDIEKAVLSLMIESLEPNAQLFFTTHNTEILDLDLPKHAFTFLRKDPDDEEQPISCIDASTLLKRNTDSLKNAVANDLFSSSPAVDLIYAISDIQS